MSMPYHPFSPKALPPEPPTLPPVISHPTIVAIPNPERLVRIRSEAHLRQHVVRYEVRQGIYLDLVKNAIKKAELAQAAYAEAKRLMYAAQAARNRSERDAEEFFRIGAEQARIRAEQLAREALAARFDPALIYARDELIQTIIELLDYYRERQPHVQSSGFTARIQDAEGHLGILIDRECVAETPAWSWYDLPNLWTSIRLNFIRAIRLTGEISKPLAKYLAFLSVAIYGVEVVKTAWDYIWGKRELDFEAKVRFWNAFVWGPLINAPNAYLWTLIFTGAATGWGIPVVAALIVVGYIFDLGIEIWRYNVETQDCREAIRAAREELVAAEKELENTQRKTVGEVNKLKARVAYLKAEIPRLEARLVEVTRNRQRSIDTAGLYLAGGISILGGSLLLWKAGLVATFFLGASIATGGVLPVVLFTLGAILVATGALVIGLRSLWSASRRFRSWLSSKSKAEVTKEQHATLEKTEQDLGKERQQVALDIQKEQTPKFAPTIASMPKEPIPETTLNARSKFNSKAIPDSPEEVAFHIPAFVPILVIDDSEHLLPSSPSSNIESSSAPDSPSSDSPHVEMKTPSPPSPSQPISPSDSIMDLSSSPPPPLPLPSSPSSSRSAGSTLSTDSALSVSSSSASIPSPQVSPTGSASPVGDFYPSPLSTKAVERMSVPQDMPAKLKTGFCPLEYKSDPSMTRTVMFRKRQQPLPVSDFPLPSKTGVCDLEDNRLGTALQSYKPILGG